MLQNPVIQPLKSFNKNGIVVDLLRLDAIHPIISGNKWYKLRFYLEEAIAMGSSQIASFGGAYSNHIVALAYACKINGLKSIGFIRGEKGPIPSPTLTAATNYGMELVYLSRSDYQQKMAIQINNAQSDRYWIPEGGYGILGANGAATILAHVDIADYTTIVASVGSGTMAAGLIIGANANQKIMGISSQKNNPALYNAVTALVPDEKKEQFILMEDYHFGGFAKHPPELINYMRHIWDQEKIPTDIVYTGKLFFALNDLINKGYFATNSKILAIHSGGLQGNQSLNPGILPY